MAGLTNVISRHRLMRGWVEAAGEPTTNTESWQGGGPRSLDGWHAALEGGPRTFRLRLLYQNSVRHGCRVYTYICIYIITIRKIIIRLRHYVMSYFVKWYCILHGVLVYLPCYFTMCMAAQDKQEKQHVKAATTT